MEHFCHFLAFLKGYHNHTERKTGGWKACVDRHLPKQQLKWLSALKRYLDSRQCHGREMTKLTTCINLGTRSLDVAAQTSVQMILPHLSVYCLLWSDLNTHALSVSLANHMRVWMKQHETLLCTLLRRMNSPLQQLSATLTKASSHRTVLWFHTFG